jgi:hypothetical protein
MQAMLDASARFPEDRWLAHMAAYAHFGRGEWAEAEAGLAKSVEGLPVMRAGAAIDLARVRRMQSPGADVGKLVAHSEYLGMLLAFETGAGLEGSPQLAYSYLAIGNLQSSVETAAQGPNANSVLWLAAASQGAPADLRRAAFEAGLPAADDQAAWSAYALAAREGVSAAELEAQLRQQPYEGVDRIFAFFAAVRGGASVEAAEAELASVSPVERGLAYSMAATYLGERCPAAWRDGARGLLFATERPWFG